MSTPKQPGVNEGSSTRTAQLMELVVSRPDMLEAYRRVKGNKGSTGVDGVAVNDLKAHLNANWEAVKVALLNGDYYPQAIRRVMVPKPLGRERQLGIPTVMDRLIQQAWPVHQWLRLIGPRRICLANGACSHLIGIRKRTHLRRRISAARSLGNDHLHVIRGLVPYLFF